LYTLHFSGFIPKPKLKEFEQTIRRVSGTIDLFETRLSMSSDMLLEDHYIVDLHVKNREMVKKLLRSDEYQQIAGCFRVLGYLQEHRIWENQMLPEGSL
jgi:hypothetical protein